MYVYIKICKSLWIKYCLNQMRSRSVYELCSSIRQRTSSFQPSVNCVLPSVTLLHNVWTVFIHPSITVYVHPPKSCLRSIINEPRSSIVQWIVFVPLSKYCVWPSVSELWTSIRQRTVFVHLSMNSVLSSVNELCSLIRQCTEIVYSTSRRRHLNIIRASQSGDKKEPYRTLSIAIF